MRRGRNRKKQKEQTVGMSRSLPRRRRSGRRGPAGERENESGPKGKRGKPGPKEEEDNCGCEPCKVPPEGIPGLGHLRRHATVPPRARGREAALPNHNKRPRQMRSPGRYKYNSQQQPFAQNTPVGAWRSGKGEGRGHTFLCSSTPQSPTSLRYGRSAKKRSSWLQAFPKPTPRHPWQ